MSKYHGKIGFACTEETSPGIYTETIIEKEASGDLVQIVGKISSSDTINNGMRLSSSISVIAEPYIKHNLKYIRYVTFMGEKWEVTDIKPSYPRLILTLGGLYND